MVGDRPGGERASQPGGRAIGHRRVRDSSRTCHRRRHQTAPAFGTGFAPTYYPATDDLAYAERVSVRAGSDSTGVNLVFQATRLSRLSGIVFSADEEKWAWPATRYLGSARAERDGRFRVEGLPPGPYLALALGYVEKGQWRDPDFLTGAARNARRVTLSAGARQTLDLPCHLQ